MKPLSSKELDNFVQTIIQFGGDSDLVTVLRYKSKTIWGHGYLMQLAIEANKPEVVKACLYKSDEMWSKQYTVPLQDIPEIKSKFEQNAQYLDLRTKWDQVLKELTSVTEELDINSYRDMIEVLEELVQQLKMRGHKS